MQNPILRNDISLRKDINHVERESTEDVSKKGKCIRVKDIKSTLFGMENDLPGGTPVCIVMAGNSTGRTSGKYMKEVFWEVLHLLQLLLELDTQASMIHEPFCEEVPY
jgi:hypothetical protein